LEQYKSAHHLLETLFNVVSYGGNLLLNVSPTKDGLIPIIQEERLKEIGFFLAVNGDAIYGTKPWKIQQHENNIWYTTKGDSVFVITTEWPDTGRIILDSVTTAHKKSDIKAVFLATRQEVTLDESEKLTIVLPALTQGLGKHNAWAFKIVGLDV
jgi:alpha-L-fucosidase